MKKITPFLWYDTQAKEAADFYVSIFKNSSVGDVSYYPDAGTEVTGMQPGTVMTVAFTLDGQDFIALNGGPTFKFNESVSFSIDCQGQEEIDYYWDNLIAGGGMPSQCGWLKDKFGLSWQVVPRELEELMTDPDREKANRVMEAMLKMEKIDVAELRRAYDGE